MDVHTKEQRSKNMRAIKSKNTSVEIILSKALWSKGYRFRRNTRTIFGSPDFSLKKFKLAVFVDSEYFHGKDWDTNKYRIKSNRDFWWNKIESNIHRDLKVNHELEKQGWTVLRFWSEDVKKNIEFCVKSIEETLETVKNAEIH